MKAMTVVSVTYPRNSGTFFDLDYYIHKHLPMVKALLTPSGLKEVELLRGAGKLDGSPDNNQMTALLRFASSADAHLSFAQHGQQIADDIPNFTDVKAVIHVNESSLA